MRAQALEAARDTVEALLTAVAQKSFTLEERARTRRLAALRKVKDRSPALPSPPPLPQPPPSEETKRWSRPVPHGLHGDPATPLSGFLLLTSRARRRDPRPSAPSPGGVAGGCDSASVEAERPTKDPQRYVKE